MGQILQYVEFRKERSAKGDKMYKELVIAMRKKARTVEDMPARAQEVLDYFGILDFSKGVPIVEILSKVGFKVYQSELQPENLSAYIAVNPKYKEKFGSNKITCVNMGDNIGHKRFALAHELAHYLFDFDETKDLVYYNTYFAKEEEQSEIELRANAFAANLLMPEKEFRKALEQAKKLKSKADIVNELGSYFQVSTTAVIRRFKELGIEGYTI